MQNLVKRRATRSRSDESARGDGAKLEGGEDWRRIEEARKCEEAGRVREDSPPAPSEDGMSGAGGETFGGTSKDREKAS